ncbi:MAG TPA: PTS sugar transporter subunit IIA [Candidatus Acidoferrales bacterium]|nr:PTS sugar transporter subunit IIA [Candidatus Acidoferrales bacterium]
MPYQLLNIEATADYLHLTPADIEQRVKDREIPFEKRGDRVLFRKSEIDAWASQRILQFPSQRLASYHEKSSRHIRELLPQEAILPEMLAAGAIAPAMTSKTKSSVLRDLVALADKTGQLNDAKTLIESLEAREELCSTALTGGLAVPHLRSQEPYLFETSFLVIGRPIQEIYFGAPDGEPTNLFFLICCQDDRLHLHTLARLCLIVQKTKVLEKLRSAPDAPTMRDALLAAEQEILALPPRKSA